MSLKLDQLLDLSNLNRHLELRNITKQKHPDLDLYVYNYSPVVQYSPELWDNETETCRGLIVSGSGEVVSRGFRKFFNLNTSYRPETHLASLPQGNPQVMEKMDGSLGILWEYEGQTGIATRGSFTSPQAVWATKFYNDHCKILLMDMHNPRGVKWPEGFTPLFEIIYPENRIVVRYDFKGLVLIGLVHTGSGGEAFYETLKFWGYINHFQPAKLYDKTLDETLADKGQGNDEGFVVTWFAPYIKVKVKFEEYCRLHRVITGMNAKTVWEMLQTEETHKELDGLIADLTLPQEFRDWLWDKMVELVADYTVVAMEARQAILDYPDYDFMFESRKHFALYLYKRTWNNMGAVSVAFSMLDGKDYSKAVWKLVKPKAAQPFKEEI